MKILALESSAGVASVALCENRRLLHLVQDDSGNNHSKSLLPMVIGALEKHRLTVSDIDLFAVSVGPGSYTGVRIGVATVKGLCATGDKPCMAVSSLEALAYALPLWQGVICPVIDARRERMYTALFERKDGKIKRLTRDGVLELSELEKLLRGCGRVTMLTGSGCEQAMQALKFSGRRAAPDPCRLENAYGVALCAYERYLESADRAVDSATLLPVYALKTQAEREREERERQNGKNT